MGEVGEVADHASSTDTDDLLARAGHRHAGPAGAVARWWVENRRAYEGGAGDERPLTGYLLLSGTYAAMALGAATLVVSRRDRATPPSAGDLVLLATATAMTTRTLTKDAVTSPLRAPVTTYVEPAGPGEVTESPRQGAVRHAVGELVTCPFCLAQWVGTAFVTGHAAAPRATRWVAAVMAVRAAANVMQAGYSLLVGAAEG